MALRDPFADVLVISVPLGAVHAFSSSCQGRRTLCMRSVEPHAAPAKFFGVTFARLREAGWRICPECERLRRLADAVRIKEAN